MNMNSNQNNIVLSGGRGSSKTTTGVNLAKKTGKKYKDIDVETTAQCLASLGMKGLVGITELNVDDLNRRIEDVFINETDKKEVFQIKKEKGLPMTKTVIDMIKNRNLDIYTYSLIVGPDIWHLPEGYFRKGESGILSYSLLTADIISTGAGTLKSEINREIARGAYNVLLIIDSRVQLERILNDPDGGARRGIIGSTEGCTLTFEEREARKLAEYDELWLPVLSNFADKVIDITEMTMDDVPEEILKAQRAQDILEYNP